MVAQCATGVQGQDGFVPEKSELRGFLLFLRTYFYAQSKGTFVPVPGMPRHLPCQICRALTALQQIETAGADVFWVQ